ncbi:MAG: hypothetical protein QW474_01090, partial [Candidatus Aenigmatarchaeota archaeon]
MKKILLAKIILGIIVINCYGQTPLITSEKQIKTEVKNAIVETAPAFNNFKLAVNNSTATLKNEITNETNARISADNSIINQLNNYVLKTGDIMSGSLTLPKIIGNQIGNKLELQIVDKISYLNYDKLFIYGDIDITGQYKINGNPISFVETDPIFVASAPVTYLFKDEKASDSDKLDGLDSSAFLQAETDPVFVASAPVTYLFKDEKASDSDK